MVRSYGVPMFRINMLFTSIHHSLSGQQKSHPAGLNFTAKDKRGVHINIFLILFHHKNINCGYPLEAPH